KPALRQGLEEIVLATRLGEVSLRLVKVAQVCVAGLSQRQLLAAHIVELLLHLRLLLQGRKLQLRVGQYRQGLTLGDLGSVLDQFLVDPPPFDCIEIDGEKGRDFPAQRQEVVERPRLRSTDRYPVTGNRHGIGLRSEKPEQNDQDEYRTGRAADQQPFVDALALDDLVH